MLILMRKPGQALSIGNDITLTILNIREGAVRIGIDAPKEVQILRDEAKLRQPRDYVDGNR